MLFCPKCGAILVPKKSNNKRVMACSCGYVNRNIVSATITEETAEKAKEVEIVEEQPETLPKTEAECPKCRHKVAYYWMQQTRAADEGETKFLKCEKCGHIWRDYG
ncbi:transcription factor S [Candidatus Woesearchaeota archaeon]|nr:transcription factor S [Candidatus Woesearchaeota archaeon]